MIKVNFLPWRESLQKLQRRNFIYSIALSLLIILIITLGIYCNLHNQVTIQIKRNGILYKYNNKLRSKKQQYVTIKKQCNLLIRKLQLIIKMYRQGEELTQILQVLFDYSNGGCWFDTAILQNNQFTAKFISKNYAASDKVAEIFARLGFLTHPQINLSTDTNSCIKFTVSFRFKQEN